MSSADEEWRQSLYSAPAGDWPSVILSPHLPLTRMKLAVEYVSIVTKALYAKAKCMCLPVLGMFRWRPTGGNTTPW